MFAANSRMLPMVIATGSCSAAQLGVIREFAVSVLADACAGFFNPPLAVPAIRIAKGD